MRRVVTLPKGANAVDFAEQAKRQGADLIEVRDDLTPDLSVKLPLPVLLSRRGGRPLELAAQYHDEELPLPSRGEGRGEGAERRITSHHAKAPLSPEEALKLWENHSTRGFIKHVEPLGDPASAGRLFETQRKLAKRFGTDRVTVLATGDCALPFRAVLAQKNAFDYLALDSQTASAAGQRLLADAVRADSPAPSPREGRGDSLSGRFALIGSRIAAARSPRVHPPPFDRWDLPDDAPIGALVDAMHPHYRGFAITSPFKRALAKHIGAPHEAINTLVRAKRGWRGANTDVDGARAVLSRHRVHDFTVLGDGGVTWALRKAAGPRMRVVTAAEATTAKLSGDLVWTWPEHLTSPAGLRLDGARVLIVAYGAAANRLSQRILRLGGIPVRAGVTWFIAQARAQRRLWSEAP